MPKIIAANWKMYKTRAEARETAAALARLLTEKRTDRQVIVYPPFTAIAEAAAALDGLACAAVGAQDVYPAAEGAFTGEISPRMLTDAGATWVLTGHSERRHVLQESDELVGRKTAFALANGLCVMLCIGETLKERESGCLREVLQRQLQAGLAEVAPGDISRLAIAYEPVWAIGTGKVAGPDEAREAHGITRELLRDVLGAAAASVPLLYGGSVKPDNAAGLLALDNVDGLLVGGASLEAESFAKIVLA
ncbi:triose-phosphate isomerase [uncultured Desulfovibrio sp.]|uniref:Triosephosphate isomerase n=1 Tax=Candidatus Desulfovibrio intestinavium TaxID=2838534 RepID=A0A9D2HNT8_9BACT|nr:triose-phosphate isomerase [uncultured Desulfovibrio sp.]HJA79194.1 triose-phosphate isomerase [Candidatus Desulfovibrio intestinavium]